MEVGLTILLFIMVILNLSTAIPLLKGLKFQIEDYTCSQEVKEVKTNIIALKIINTLSAIASIVAIVLYSI